MRWIVPLAVFLALTAGTALGAGSGISGRVTSSPTCPVERMPPDPQCAPRGFVAHVRVRRQSDHRVVARVTTGSDGRFRISLRPGRYLVSARPASGQSLPRCPGDQQVKIVSGRYTSIKIDCDSGIR